MREMRRLRISPANIGPNPFHHSRTVSWQMSMPRSIADPLRSSATAGSARIITTRRITPTDFGCHIGLTKQLKMVEQMGKGRFAQRLATRVPGKLVPDYLADAINHAIGLV